MNAQELTFRKQLGDRIKELRLQKGFQQTELAAKLQGKDKQFINRYEIQGANPTAFTLFQLSLALEVSVQEIMDLPIVREAENKFIK